MALGNGFQNKRVVILGGSSGIGLAVAEEAAAQGANVLIGSSNAERIQKAMGSIAGEVEGQAVDVSDERAVESFFGKVGSFDHLIYTAGDNLHLQELRLPTLARRGARLNCAIGLRSLWLNTGARIFVRTVLSFSQPESQGSGQRRDG